MTSLIWDDKFNTGVAALDAQHRKIFDYMTHIYSDLIDNSHKCDSINGMLDQLEILCQLNLFNEDQLMDETNYPLSAEHKHQHDLFLATLDQLKIDNNQCHSPNIISKFTNIIENYISHMLTGNMLLSEFIKNNSGNAT